MENFEDMEMDVQPKRKRIEPKPVAKSPKPKAPDQVDKIVEMANRGFNVNQIASMLALHSQFVKQVIDKANEDL